MDIRKYWNKRLGRKAFTLFLVAIFVLLITHIDNALSATFKFNFLQALFCLYMGFKVKSIHEYLYK